MGQAETVESFSTTRIELQRLLIAGDTASQITEAVLGHAQLEQHAKRLVTVLQSLTEGGYRLTEIAAVVESHAAMVMAAAEIGLLRHGVGPQSESLINLAAVIKIKSLFMQPFDVVDQPNAALITKSSLLGNGGLTTGALHGSSLLVKNSR